MGLGIIEAHSGVYLLFDQRNSNSVAFFAATLVTTMVPKSCFLAFKNGIIGVNFDFGNFNQRTRVARTSCC